VSYLYGDVITACTDRSILEHASVLQRLLVRPSVRLSVSFVCRERGACVGYELLIPPTRRGRSRSSCRATDHNPPLALFYDRCRSTTHQGRVCLRFTLSSAADARQLQRTSLSSRVSATMAKGSRGRGRGHCCIFRCRWRCGACTLYLRRVGNCGLRPSCRAIVCPQTVALTITTTRVRDGVLNCSLNILGACSIRLSDPALTVCR